MGRKHRPKWHPRIVEVGDGTYGANLITIREWQQGSVVRIGKYCSIAPDITILLGENHAYDRITTYPFQKLLLGSVDGAKPDSYTNGDVVIGHDVWLGIGSTIISGISIGSGAIVAAYSHVVKDVPPYCVVGGNPARIIRKRFTEEEINEMLALKWWDHADVHSISKLLISGTIQELKAALAEAGQ